ncbi:MAG: TIGR01777 family protein, partial [Planctomycetes bacterium]|nr:TIGR01777 family protein [Planctomycetota bacterium]
GLIGQEFTTALLNEGHQVWVLSRNPQTSQVPTGAAVVSWDGHTSRGWEGLVELSNAVVNLAGENIGAGSWSNARKERIRTSRKNSGQAVVAAFQAASRKPKVLLQASAIGFYGPSDDRELSEESPAGNDFLSSICLDWEASTQLVEKMGVRRVIIRTGLVMTTKGGVLPRLMLPFRLFLGGPLGSGQQWYSWIAMQDEIRAMLFLLKNEQAAGAYNLTSPEPLRMSEFGKVLASIIHRPYWLPAPAFALRTLLGEMSILVLTGQKVVPQKLLAEEFHFQFPTLKSALENLLH